MITDRTLAPGSTHMLACLEAHYCFCQKVRILDIDMNKQSYPYERIRFTHSPNHDSPVTMEFSHSGGYHRQLEIPRDEAARHIRIARHFWRRIAVSYQEVW